MDPASNELFSPTARRVLTVLWSLTIGLWAFALVGFLADANAAARALMIAAISVMFFAFVASSIVMMRAGMKARK